MDRPNIFLSLLLTFWVTAAILGSPVKDEYPDDKELQELQSDEELSEYPEMVPYRKELEALLSDGGSSNFPEMIPNREEVEAVLMRSNQSNPIMEKDTEMSPNTQESKDLLLISKDQDSQKTKRVDPATVIAGAALAVDVLDKVLTALGNIKRKIAIGIENKSGYRWTAINVYFYSGTADKLPPDVVQSGKALLYGARKSSSSWRGVVGVMTYCIPKLRKTLAVMFSVPYDYNWYSNWWDVRLYPGYERADYYLWKKMYYGNPIKADHSRHTRILGSGLYSRGGMTDNGAARLEIHVKKY